MFAGGGGGSRDVALAEGATVMTTHMADEPPAADDLGVIEEEPPSVGLEQIKEGVQVSALVTLPLYPRH